MLAQAVGDVRTAVHHIQHARRQARLQRQLRQVERGGGILLGRLEHKGIAAGHGDRNMKQGSITGKLKAVMPAQTPSGWIKV